MKTLVTGGVRSGKSAHAESLLATYDHVTYVALGPVPDPDADPEWAARVRLHQERRPASWTTLETSDLASALRTEGPLLVDCLGTWLTALLDDAELWDATSDTPLDHVRQHLDAATEALTTHPGPIVIVTNEVGLGVVPAHRSGRLFRDLLGTTNQVFGSACDEVRLVVVGRVLVL